MDCTSDYSTNLAISIRKAEASDVPSLQRLFRETVLTHGPSYYTEAQIYAWAVLAEDIENFNHLILDVTTYVAEDGTGILGFAGIGDTGRIASLYVRHDQLRQGIGSALMRHLLAKAEGDRLLRLYTEASEFSRGLFAKFGFDLYETETIERYGVVFLRYLMERTLSNDEPVRNLISN